VHVVIVVHDVATKIVVSHAAGAGVMSKKVPENFVLVNHFCEMYCLSVKTVTCVCFNCDLGALGLVSVTFRMPLQVKLLVEASVQTRVEEIAMRMEVTVRGRVTTRVDDCVDCERVVEGH
jgi:hypothetical protein